MALQYALLMFCSPLRQFSIDLDSTLGTEVKAIMADFDGDIEGKILSLLAVRTAGPGSATKTICPSEVARALWPEDWRDHMETVRVAANNLAAQHRLIITQKGQPIDMRNVHGPIRLGLPR